MKYTRKDNHSNKIISILTIFCGVGILYLGFAKIYWLWNLITIPLGLITTISGYKNYKRADLKIKEVEFKDNELQIEFLNGSKKEIKYDKLRYSLLVKKFHKPIRSIEIIEKGKIGKFRGKSIGVINFKKWEKNIESIAKHLITNDFERKKWKFSWGIGEFLMIFSILFGFAEGIAENYIGNLTFSVSESIGDIGGVLAEQNNRSEIESKESERKYLDKN